MELVIFEPATSHGSRIDISTRDSDHQVVAFTVDSRVPGERDVPGSALGSRRGPSPRVPIVALRDVIR